MGNTTFIAAFLGIQVGFIGLDLWDRRSALRTGEVRGGTVMFLAAVAVVYLILQVGLTALAPRIDTQAESLREAIGGWTGSATPAETMPIGAAILVGVVAFYLGGLFDYLIHRFFSHARPFFWTHEYHHLPREVFVALPGLSVRPFSVFTAIPTAFATMGVAYGVMVAFGWPLWELDPLRYVALANVFVLTTSHSSFLRRHPWTERPFRWLGLTSPAEHLVHHSVDRAGNYANIIILWDRVFGTYVDPDRAENQGRRLGLDYDQDFLGTLTFGRWKLPARWRTRFQVGRYCNLATNAADPEYAPIPRQDT